MKQNINLTINIPIIDSTSDKERVIGDATPASIMINKFHKNEDGTIIIDDFRFVSMSIDMEYKI